MSLKLTIKKTMIGAGFATMRATRLPRLLAPWTGGQGAILMLHHVRPWAGDAFAPNRMLEIEPAFLDAALTLIAARGFDFVSMDEAIGRIGQADTKPFVALTFDDGYRDNITHALPILERHAAPFALYVTTGFADRTARLWWVELEAAVRALPTIDVEIAGGRIALPCGTPLEKTKAFEAIYWALRAGSETALLSTIGQLLAEAGLSSDAFAADLCLDWPAIRDIARHPLCTIGVHTLTHPRLATLEPDAARDEMQESRRRIEMETGLPARHIAYPVGDICSAGQRDYAIAAEIGFRSAVTTRPGMIFPAQAAHPMSLPRLSVNGHWQTVESLDILLSGLPFALWNRGRHVVC